MEEQQDLDQNYTLKSSMKVWKDFIRFLKQFRWWLMGVGLCMLVISAIEVSLPLMIKYAIDTFIVPGQTEGLMTFGIRYMALIVVMSAIVFVFIALAGKVEMDLVYVLRRDGFEKLQKLSYSYYDKNATGRIMSRLTSDITRVGEIVAWGLVDFVWSISMMAGIMVIMFITNWKLALAVMAVIPVLIGISIFFQEKMLKTHRVIRKINSRITGAFNEGILGAKTSKVLNREGENINEFGELTGTMKRKSVQAAIFSALYLPMVIGLGAVGTVLVLGLGGTWVADLTVSLGTLVLFLNYTVRFFDPVREFARVFAEMQSAQAALERIISLIDAEPDIVDSAEILDKYGDFGEKIETAGDGVAGHITFDDVTFHYTPEEPVLTNFSLDVAAGETIALVGETGSGKSTIVNLACRFYEPISGKILIDGVDYRERSQHWLHAHLGYVLQSPHLFSGSILENIRYGRLDATDEEVKEAARIVDAEGFILRLEADYHTEVGEGGTKLSTGEKQLISFARAVLANPRIFILDEATSSVDTETEMKVQNAIEKVLEGRTSFIIAHRLSTIRNADRILVIEKGRVIESGSHDQLMNRHGHYYTLYRNQYIEEREMELLA